MTKAALKFLLIFIVTYAIQILFPKVGDKYAAFIRSEGQYFLGNFKEKAVVQFRPNPDAHAWNFPNIIIIYNSDQYDRSLTTGGNYQYSKISLSLYHDFLFAAFLTSLILATPLTLRRKLSALLFGLVLMHLYINFTFYIELLYTCNTYSYLELVHLSSFWSKAVSFIHPIVRANYGTGFFIGVLIWIVVCFRKEDLNKLLNLEKKVNKKA